MVRFLRIIGVLVLLAAPLFAHAGNQLVIDERFEQKVLLKDFLHRWTGERKTLEELLENLQFFSLWKDFNINDSSQIDNSTHLQMMLNIANVTDREQKLLLVHPYPTLDLLQIVYLVDGQVISRLQAGNDLPFDARPIPHRHLVFPLDIKPGQNVTILLEADGIVGDLFRDFALWERQAFFERTDSALIFYSILSGALLLLFFSNLFLFAFVLETSYFWFSLFTLSILARVLVMNNLPFEFLWPDTPWVQNMAIVISVMASSVLLFLFAVTYLSINKGPRGQWLVYQTFFLLAGLFLAYQAAAGWPLHSTRLWLVIALPYSIFLWVHSVWLVKNGNRNARYFLAAYSILIFGAMLVAGSHHLLSHLPLNMKADLPRLLFIIILSIVLAVRVGKERYQMQLADAENRAKSDFLAKMSHEIRTPINGVIGMAQLLSETPLSRKQKHYADVINHCGKNLLNIINDILEYAKIESGKLECAQIKFNIDSLLLSNNSLFWPQINAKHIQYACRIDPKIPHNIIGDPARLQQIFNNLFSNAIKFTDHGKITFNVRLLRIDHNTAHIEFMLSDTGIGIAEDELERIFVPFSQASSSTNRFYGGSGLGLSITRQLAELMGGKIAVHSELRIGTGFSLQMPFLIDTDEEYLRQEKLLSLAGKQVLALSGDPSEKDPVMTALCNWQMLVSHFSAEENALAMLNGKTADNFDLFCIAAPLLENLQYQERHLLKSFSSKLLIYDHQFHEAGCQLNGFENAHFLRAPFSMQQLQEQVSEIAGLSAIYIGNVTATANTTFKPRDGLKILVAEDDATNRMVIRAVLKKLNIQHDIVSNGLLAVESYKSTPDAYNIILMDCEMPVMDGYRAAEEIRHFEKNACLKEIPLIALTAHVLPEYEDKCYKSGMSLVIAKPIDIQQLTAAFDRFCSDRPLSC